MKRIVARLALSSGAAVAPTLALAQSIGAGTSIVIDPHLYRQDVAGARIEPAFRPHPVLIGPVFAQPGISVVGGYESNVFNGPEGAAAAVVTVIPSLSLQADMPRHALNLSTSGTFRRFSRYRTENSEEFALEAGARLDLGERQTVKTSAGFAHLIEPRSSAGSVPDAAEPVSYGRLLAETSIGFNIGKFRLSPGLRYQSLRYGAVALLGGGKADQSFRDTQSIAGDIRLDYDFSGLVSAFIGGGHENIKSTSTRGPLRRDSRTRSVYAGLNGELSRLVSGEVALGYQSRDYAEPTYRDFHGLTFRADLQWYVTPLMTLRAEASRAFRNSGDRRVGGILTDAFVLSAYHDPLPNLRLAASARLERGDYGEVGTRTWRKSARLQAQYRLTPVLSFGGYAGFLRQDVSGPPLVNRFTSFSAGFGLTATS